MGAYPDIASHRPDFATAVPLSENGSVTEVGGHGEVRNCRGGQNNYGQLTEDGATGLRKRAREYDRCIYEGGDVLWRKLKRAR